MNSTRLSFLALAALLAGCGGGGSNSDPPPPPPPPGIVLSTTLVETGSFGAMNPSAALSGFQVLNSRAEYDAFASGHIGPTNPEILRELDYAQSSVLYVEGPATDALADTARLVEIRRTGGTQDAILGERCMSDPAGIPTPSRAHRPFAYYIIPKLNAGATFAWRTVATGCLTVAPIVATFVASGDWGGVTGRPAPPAGVQVIRTQAGLEAVLPSFAPGGIPTQYRTPDFTQVALILVQMPKFVDPTYVRVASVILNEDGSRDVIAEYCGQFFAHAAFAGTMAIYAVPQFTEPLRTTVILHSPGSCILSP